MKIGEVSATTQLSIHTIRYYEKQGLIRKATKDSSGHRRYSNRDVDIIEWVVCMKNSGMPLRRIKKYSEALYNDDHATCLVILHEHLSNLQQHRADIAHHLKVTQSKILRLSRLSRVVNTDEPSKTSV